MENRKSENYRERGLLWIEAHLEWKSVDPDCKHEMGKVYRKTGKHVFGECARCGQLIKQRRKS